MPGQNEQNNSGFIWGIIIGILGLLFFPSLKKGLKELGVLVLKEGLELKEAERPSEFDQSEIEILREKLKMLENQLENQKEIGR